MNGYKRISEVEMVIWVASLFVLYILNDLLDATVVGVVAAWLFNFASTTGLWWFFKQKGDTTASKPGSLIAQFSANLIPFVPAPIIAFMIKTHIHNRAQRENGAAPANT